MAIVLMSTIRSLLAIFFITSGGAIAMVTQAQAAESADGEGKALVEGVCTTCHSITQLTRSSGYSREDWHALTASMIDLSANSTSHNKILDYLAASFPPNTRRQPVLMAGDVQIALKEWVTPTLGQRARDPVEAPDGSIWWAGQFGNLIGRIDPVHGTMQEFVLPAGVLPHSVSVDSAGDIWYSGNGNATIGRFDARSGNITVYAMPDPAARDPHTMIFDARGILWFTVQHSNMIGRLDPANGEVRLVTMRTPDSRPYGIKVDAQGALWVACNGSNCLVRVDPQSMQLTEIKLPVAATRVRRLDIASDGMIWYVNSTQGKLGRYNPRTGKITERPSPSGAKSHPYAIAVIDGIVWYNESGTRPDTLVRFDPARQSFQSWAIPSGTVYAGIVRHMRPTRDGNLLIHQSSTNRIMLVNVRAGS